jgi:hypothetical protein
VQRRKCAGGKPQDHEPLLFELKAWPDLSPIYRKPPLS